MKSAAVKPKIISRDKIQLIRIGLSAVFLVQLTLFNKNRLRSLFQVPCALMHYGGEVRQQNSNSLSLAYQYDVIKGGPKK